jgi:hypothetical protein
MLTSVSTGQMTTDEFLRYLAAHETLRDLEPTFTGLLMRARLRKEAAELATVTVIRADGTGDEVDISALEAAG